VPADGCRPEANPHRLDGMNDGSVQCRSARANSLDLGDAACERLRDVGLMHPATARSIAQCAHTGQQDRRRILLTEHVERVARAVSREAQAVAYLHDVLEATETALVELTSHGLTRHELGALRLLTRDPVESYELYVLRIAHAPGDAGRLAREVKLADLADHVGRRCVSR
jgi:hypothetical protein